MTDDRDPNPSEPRAADFDSPWKEAIDAYFRPFMALFFPAVHDRVLPARLHEIPTPSR